MSRIQHNDYTLTGSNSLDQYLCNGDEDKDVDDDDEEVEFENDDLAGEDMHTTLTKRFVGLTVFTLLLLNGLLISVVFTMHQAFTNSENEALESQVDKQVSITLNEAGKYFIRQLNDYEQSVVNVMKFGFENVIREDFESSFIEPVFYDNDQGVSGMPPNLFTDPYRSYNGRLISTDHGMAFITEKGHADISSFDTELQKMINRTAYIDPFVRHAYNSSKSMYALYAGFDLQYPLFRNFPSRATYASSTTYNPTGRPWYEAAKTAGDKAIFTSPYKDAHGAGWMITGSRIIYNTTTEQERSKSSKSVIGVVGIDILINEIAETLNATQFLKTGKMTLLQSNGQVVADQDWDFNDPDSDVFYYSDLTNPPLSEGTWTAVEQLEPGSTSTYSQGGHKIYASRLSDYDGQYFVLVFILEKEIFDPIIDIQKENNQNAVNTTVFLVILCSVLLVVITTVVVLLIRSILRTFKDVEKNVSNFLRNVGDNARSLGDGMTEVNEGNARELSTLQSNINTMIYNLQRQRNQEEDGGGTVNVTKGGEAVTMQDLLDLLPVAVGCDGTIASAPPVQAFIVPDDVQPVKAMRL